MLLFTAVISFAAEPVLRIGIMTDTHITGIKTSCNILKDALTLFMQKKVDMVVNLGDVSEVYDELAYKNYRDTVKEVYGDTLPREVFVFANHDRMAREKESVWTVFEDVKKHLEVKNDFYGEIKLKGYTFLVIPQFADRAKYIAMLDKAVKENPGKPIFVFDHVPAFDTVFSSQNWGHASRRAILNNYPQVVQISGHVHGTLTNELHIWQGEFTAVNAGSLAPWCGWFIGSEPVSMESGMALILEVYPDKLHFRRFFADTKKEYGADKPWIVPIPFDPKTAPYTIARRKAESSAPDFADDAKVDVVCNMREVQVTFPGVNGAFRYKVELFKEIDGAWKRYARKDCVSEFMKPVAIRSATVAQKFDIGYFEAGKAYRVKITPVNFFDKEGRSITSSFTVKKRAADKVVFESKDPMKELAFMDGLVGGKAFKIDSDGYYIHDCHNGRLIFPDHVWEGKAGTGFRFTIDMQTIQNDPKRWTLCLRNPNPLSNGSDRIATEGGDSGVQRYVITFSKAGDLFNYYLLIREGRKGKIRFDYVKIERID